MRRIAFAAGALLLVIAVAACGSSGKDLVQTTGTIESRAAVTPTPKMAASTSSTMTTAPAATTTGTPTPTPTPEPTATPTPQPTPTPKPQAVAVVAQGYGQPTDGRSVGWAFIVENPNAGLAVESSKYQIAFTDANGTIIKTDSGYLELLLPSEKTAVSGQTYLPEGATAAKMDVTFSQGDTTSFDVTETFKTDEVTYLADKYFPKVTGVISNPYTNDLQDVRLSAVAYDANNAIIGSGFTYLNFIPAGGSSAASTSVTSSAPPDHVELYASISGLTTFADSASKPDKGQALVISKQGYGVLSTLGSAGYGFIVENPNTGQAFENSLFQVAIYDESGAVIGTDDGYITLLLAGEKLGIGGDISLPDGKSPSRVVVQVLKGDAGAETTTQMFSTDNVQYVSDKYFPKATGLVKNLTDKQLENIRVSAIAFNDAGDIIGGGFTYLDFVPANAQAAAEVSVKTSGTPARVELYPTISGLTNP